MDTKTINLRDVPADVVRKAKACAALQGVSLKTFIIEAVRKVVDESGPQIALSAAFFVGQPAGHQEKRERKRKSGQK